MSDQCALCINFIATELGKGTCHNSPPLPVGEYLLDIPSPWPIVNTTDLCGQFIAGSHGGLVCNLCINYIFPAGTTRFTATYGECHANPPTAVGEYQGDLSAWPCVASTNEICHTCYIPWT